MVPGRLVTIRYYGDRESGLEDAARLLEAGIRAYRKGACLMVPEERAEQARALLPEPPASLLAPIEKVVECPRCGARDYDPQPPYTLIAMIAGTGSLFFAAVYGSKVEMLTVLATVVVVCVLVETQTTRWRCRGCGHRFGQEAELTNRQAPGTWDEWV